MCTLAKGDPKKNDSCAPSKVWDLLFFDTFFSHSRYSQVGGAEHTCGLIHSIDPSDVHMHSLCICMVCICIERTLIVDSELHHSQNCKTVCTASFILFKGITPWSTLVRFVVQEARVVARILLDAGTST